MRNCLFVCLSAAFALPVLAETPADSLTEPCEVVHVRIGGDGQLIYENSGPGARENTIYYGNTGGNFYGTTSTPRWHVGDICSFAPENIGATNTLINVVRFPIQMADGSLNTTGRVNVRFWNLDPTLCDPTNGVFDSLIGGFNVTINPPGLSDNTPGNGQGIIFLFQVAVDDVFAATNGLVVPTDQWGVELTYRDLADAPHTIWSLGFATNMVDTAVPTNPLNCTDPLTQPNPGSSLVNATGDAVYLRDINADGIMTAGPGFGCAGTPVDIRGFANTCPERIIANVYLELTFDPPPVACGLDQTVTDTDGNGSELVTLDANCSTDDTLIDVYTWSEGATQLVTGPSSVESLTFTVGVHNLTLEVEDEFGVTSTAAVRIEVRPGGGACSCDGDLVGSGPGTAPDGVVTIADLAVLLSMYGLNPTDPCADFDGSGGPIGISDLALLLSAYGSPCP